MTSNRISKLLFLLLAILLLAGCSCAPVSEDDAEDTQLRGIWLSYNEYEVLGLSASESEETYRENADKFLAEAQKYKINTVFLHARAFDDAFWRSKTFHASKYLGADESLIADEAYANFDPFGVFLEEAHKNGIKVHAWLNPYRVNADYYYDPADKESTVRLLTAVKELLELDSNGEKVDGIHLDDYFYHAASGYFKVGNPDEKYTVEISPEEKRANINKMVKTLHSFVAIAGNVFGISPAGNYENDMFSGADIDTWLSEEGYVDYIIPQIFWSNEWGDDGKTTLFTNRLNLFLEKKTNNVKFYVGLGLYRTDESQYAGEPGWMNSKTNLAEQIEELESKSADGYVYFSARYLYNDNSKEELENVRKYVYS